MVAIKISDDNTSDGSVTLVTCVTPVTIMHVRYDRRIDRKDCSIRIIYTKNNEMKIKLIVIVFQHVTLTVNNYINEIFVRLTI